MGCASANLFAGYACIRRNRVGEGEARPTGLSETVNGREAGVVRPAAEGEDTARLDDDALRAALAD